MQNFPNLCRIWSWSTDSWHVVPKLRVLAQYNRVLKLYCGVRGVKISLLQCHANWGRWPFNNCAASAVHALRVLAVDQRHDNSTPIKWMCNLGSTAARLALCWWSLFSEHSTDFSRLTPSVLLSSSITNCFISDVAKCQFSHHGIFYLFCVQQFNYFWTDY